MDHEERDDSTPGGARRARGRQVAALAAILAAVLALAAWPRAARGLRHEWSTVPAPPAGVSAGQFFSLDPDGLYHMRRVERALDEGRVDGFDPFLAFPDGAAIPWPPYYDALLARAAAPFAPEEPAARRRFVETWVASAPFLFGLATALVAAWAAWRAAGLAAALAAGALFALTRGAYNYAQLGAGDHHAWISLLMAIFWAGFARAVERGALREPRRGALAGLGLGLVLGLALGSWVASLAFAVLADVVLGAFVCLRARRAAPALAGLGAFGLALHAAALAALAPALWASPWRASSPWITVNLSWFQPFYLALGALVFAPLCLPRLALAQGAPLAPGARGARLYPLAVALALGGLAALLALFETGPAAGVREAFAWASRENAFMDVVRESRPLFGDGRGAEPFIEALGLAAFAAPLAWLALARAAWREQRDELWVWALPFPFLALQALGQVRFTDALAVPLSVVLGFGFAELARRLRLRALVWAPAALALALASNYKAFAPGALLRVGYDPPSVFWGPPERDGPLGERLLYEWMRERAPLGPGELEGTGPVSVLAHWDDGHAIEWVAGRPSVATNFGSYVGLESYADPPRALLAESAAEAEAILAGRRARFVVVTRDVFKNFATLVRVARPAETASYFDERGALGPRAFGTLAARLVPVAVAETGRRARSLPAPPDGLRLVHVSPVHDAKRLDPRTGAPLRAGFVWERVPGALVELRGAPGETLELALELEYMGGGYVLEYRASAAADAQGIARLRVPYAAPGANGDGVARAPLAWSFAGRRGALAIDAADVMRGATVSP